MENQEIREVPEPIADESQDKSEIKTSQENTIIRNRDVMPIKSPAQLEGKTTYLRQRDESGPWKVVVPPEIPWPTVSSSDDRYNRKWIRRMWEEGFQEVGEFSDWLELHPDLVIRLLREMGLSLNHYRCSICRRRGHNRGSCPDNPYLPPEVLSELRESNIETTD